MILNAITKFGACVAAACLISTGSLTDAAPLMVDVRRQAELAGTPSLIPDGTAPMINQNQQSLTSGGLVNTPVVPPQQQQQQGMPVASNNGAAPSLLASTSNPPVSDQGQTQQQQQQQQPVLGAPAITNIPGVDAAAVSARQTVLNSILAQAHAQAASDPTATQSIPTLGALITAHQTYASAGTSDAAQALYASVLDHIANGPNGAAFIANLKATDANFAAADSVLAADRGNECSQLQTMFASMPGQITAAAKQCMCDPAQTYTYCRMVVANEMKLVTQGIQSTAAPEDVSSAFSEAFPEGLDIQAGQLDTQNNWQPPTSNNVASLLDIDNSNAGSLLGNVNGNADSLLDNFNSTVGKIEPFNPFTGEIAASACFGEGMMVCLKASGTLPSYKIALSSVSGAAEDMVDECVINKECKHTPIAKFASSAANELSKMGLEIGVSMCLGLPGIVDILNRLGISLCFDLLRLGLYPLQGPVGSVSTALNLFAVKLSAWGKLKLANAAPVCPQDFNKDMMAYSCAHKDVYAAFKHTFEDQDFCRLSAGKGHVGVSLDVDLFFWNHSYNFAQQPAKRPARDDPCH